MSEKKLTDKQKLFADYYVGEAMLNATRASRLAGYKGDENTLGVNGARLLRNAKVREYIEKQLQDLALSQNEVLTILTRQAKASLADVLDEDGRFDLGDAKRRGVDGLLKKLKIKKTVFKTGDVEWNHEYEMYDAQAAAVHLGKVHKLFIDRQEVSLDLSNLTDEELQSITKAKG